MIPFIRFWLLAMCTLGLTHSLLATPIRLAGATSVSEWINRITTVIQDEQAVTISYQAVGSKQGVQLLLDHDTDVALSDVDMSHFPDISSQNHTQIPVALTGIAVLVHLPNIPILKLNSQLLSQILMGQITNWNHPALATLNQTVTLPTLPIQLIRRAQPNGTDFIVSYFLSETNFEWNTQMGLIWQLLGPATATTSELVAKQVKDTVGAIGFSESTLAAKYGLQVAAVQNQSGRFVLPTPTSIRLAVMDDTPKDTLNTSHVAGYPLTAITWAILPKRLDALMDYNRAKDVANLIWWMAHDGQIEAETVGQAPMPSSMMRLSDSALHELRYDDVILR